METRSPIFKLVHFVEILSFHFVFQALAAFAADILEHCGLTLETTKTKIYEATGRRPPEAPPTMPLAGVKVGEQWLPGFTCYGVEIGSNAYVKHSLRARVEEIIDQIDKVMHLLRDDPQAAWVLLSTAHAHQLDYSLTLQYPSDMLEGAELLDARLWAALEQLSGQPDIPRGRAGGVADCILELPGGLEGRSFPSLQVAQPVKLGGCGLRSLVETRYPAFIGGLEQALPQMVTSDLTEVPISPHLREAVGSMEGPQRWADFLEAGSRTSTEFQLAWEAMVAKATATWQYMEEEPSGALSTKLEDQAGAAEGGHAAQAADVGFEEAPRQGGTACHSLPQHLRGQVCRELASSNTQPRSKSLCQNFPRGFLSSPFPSLSRAQGWRLGGATSWHQGSGRG